jgi:hypothetical protein
MQWPVDTGEALTTQYFDEHFSYGAGQTADCRHVFRSFAWNEDGALSAVADGTGDASGCGVNGYSDYVRRSRPVGTTFLRDDADAAVRNYPAFVQLGIGGDDDSWIQVPAVVWRDRAGFTIPLNPLWRWHPYASAYARHATSGGQTLFDQYAEHSYLTLLHNTLRGSGTALVLRLAGSVECDEAVRGSAPRRLTSSWPLVAEKVVRAESRLRLREVPSGSDPFDLGASRHDIRDDSAAAAGLAEHIRGMGEHEVGRGSILLRHLTRAYAPGDVIPATCGRVIDLTVRSGERTHAPVVMGVAWSFDDPPNKTELALGTSPAEGTR